MMPVYNAEPFLAESIESILRQTFGDYEFIILDDGSTDHSADIIRSYMDPRIRFHQQENHGVVAARNKLLDLAGGEYLTFFDADDVALETKLEAQLKWLKAHPDTVLLGSSAELIDRNGKNLGYWRLSDNKRKNKALMLFQNQFVNSAVVFRKEAVGQLRYPEGLDSCEDYWMWWSLMGRGEGTNIPEVLLKYRIHDNSLTGSQPAKLASCDRRLFRMVLEDIGIAADELEIRIHSRLRQGLAPTDPAEIKQYAGWIPKVVSAAVKSSFIPPHTARWVAMNRWMKLLRLSMRKPTHLVPALLNIPFYRSLFKLRRGK